MSVNVKENGNLTKVGGLYIPSQFPHDDTKADQDSIANVENDTTASQAYSVGELFYHNGSVCRATASIASGAPLTEGTNFAYVKISDYLTIKKANITLNANLTWLSMTNANRVCRRYGNMVEYRGYFTLASMPQLTSNTTFFTLPWTKTGTTAFCQVRSNLSGYPMVMESFRVPSDSKNIIVQSGVQLPDAGYYIQITYMTEDAF